MRRNAGSCLVRSSRAATRSCPTPPKPKLLLSRWQRACPKASLSAGLVLDPKIRCPAWPVPHLPKKDRFRLGAVRSLPLSHPLKGKPVLVRIAAASSAALPSASARGFPSEDVPPSVRLGCGWEGSPPLPEDRLGHTRKLSRFLESTKWIPPVDNEDNGHKSARPEPAHAPLAPRAPLA